MAFPAVEFLFEKPEVAGPFQEERSDEVLAGKLRVFHRQ